MKIASSSILLNSQSESLTQHQTDERLVMGRTAQGVPWSEDNLQDGLVFERSSLETKATFSQQGLASLLTQSISLADDSEVRPQVQPMPEVPSPVVSGSNHVESVTPADETSEETQMDADLFLLKHLVEKMIGRNITVFQLRIKNPEELTELTELQANPQSGENEVGGFGLRYHFEERIEEQEYTSFNAKGEIHTEDGKSIEIDVNLNLSRSFIETNRINIEVGAARMKDPLVINYAGQSAELTNRDFSFDIDADGEQNTISFVRSGSGFLALDQNNDGVINDGAELFGALSGDGFRELAAYDEDGNRWIDENDTVFDELLVWTRNNAGEDTFYSLTDLNIGAIHLDNAATAFSLVNEANELNGQLRSTGIYLTEEGKAGTIQQIDLVA